MSSLTASDTVSPSGNQRYSSVAIALHWVMALAILSLIPGGWIMTDMANDNPLKEGLYQLHKSVGITILILTIARIAWRIMNPPPADAEGLKGWEQMASHAAHYGFYALMILLPLTGWLYVSTAYAFDVPTVLYGIVSWPDLPFMGALSNEAGHGAIEFVHSKLAWVALALVAVHVAGALKHEFGPEEGVLKRMIPGLFGKTDGPRAPSRGALSAFGGAFAVFAVVAVTPVIAQGGAADLSGSSSFDANWAIDADASPTIRFSGTHDGSQYTGEFELWDATIAFDPENLAASRVEVTVDLASAVANKKLYTDSLRATEWLDVSGSQTASVVLDLFDGTEPNYTANAALSLKGATIDVPFEFELFFEGDQAFLEGETRLSRVELDVGMESDPGADWVSDEILIEVSLAANRITD
ncbi:MAG: cytochrome b/b6 domain-containing protein [Pseudomonadota bacterium]